ncbi:MAG TPA: hypothetical protein VGM67_18295 [Gemmatimonadaceae bacterium]|jgi:hypothetical protein
MAFTIYCCGTSSNSFDAFGDMERPQDEWDKKPKEFEQLWRDTQSGDVNVRTPAKVKFDQIVATRRATVTLRKNYYEGEIVSTLAKNNRGHEYADWILIDGPGSGNYQSKMLWVKPGDYSDAHGIATGAGMDENVKHAIAVLKNEPGHRTLGVTPQMLQQQIIKMRRKKVVPTAVNLIGWSRGAVTCIMIANAIAADKALEGVSVRIFAVDPVPGGVNQSFYSSMTQLPKCVTEYYGVYARDEVSRGFSPVIPKKMSTHTAIWLLPLPGMHASVAGNSWVDKKSEVRSVYNLQGPGRVARYWAERCLTRWGVEMQRTAYYTDLQLCAMYDEMLENDPEFRRMRNYGYVAGRRQGYWDPIRDVYIEGTGYMSNYWSFDSVGGFNQQMSMMVKVKGKTFVNWHHQETYKLAHRKAWNRLTRGY